jgi:hypothetical protein
MAYLSHPRITREWKAPDLWAELQSNKRLVASVAIGAADNSPFSPEEKEKIARQLTEIKTYVRRTHKLTEDQYTTIDARLDYLIDAAERGMGRIDWRNAFVGAFLGAVVQAVLPPSRYRTSSASRCAA